MNKNRTFVAFLLGMLLGRTLQFFLPTEDPWDLAISYGFTFITVGILLALGRPKVRCESVAPVAGELHQCVRRAGHRGRHEINLRSEK